MEPVDLELEEAELELPSEPMNLNMGPRTRDARHHPHGAPARGRDHQGRRRPARLPPPRLREDERARHLAHVFPYTDRLNYVSPLLNNVGYALAVEKLAG